MAEQAPSEGLQWLPSVTGRLLELTADVACVASSEGTLVEVSGQWAELLGYSCDELIGRPLVELVHPSDREGTADILREARGGQDIAQYENRFVARDGSTRWFQWTAVRGPDESRYYAVAIDLTPRRAAEEDLRESEHRYLDLIESSHDLVQSILPDGHFEFVNRAWHDTLGYSPEELPELTLFDIVDGVDHEHCTLMVQRIMSGESFEQVEVTFVAKDGRAFPVEGNATGRFRDGEFVATHAFFRDVSERRRAEELSAQYQAELEREVAERTAALVQSEKLATLGRLSAGMAHELNNPAAAAQRGGAQLRGIFAATCTAFFELVDHGLSADDAGFLAEMVTKGADLARTPGQLDPIGRADEEAEIEEWLEDHGLDRAWELADPLVNLGVSVDDLEGLAARFSAAQLPLVLDVLTQSHTAFVLVEQITHGSQRISEIVTALKEYSFMDRAPVQEIDVHDGLDNTLVMLGSKLKRGVHVQREYAEDLPRIDTRGSELNQVWTNLIDNAVDAMGGTGDLVVRTRAEGDGVVVEIEDDGPGIAPDVVDNVFDPFFTTKGPGEGTGLGLSIVFNIVREFGGRVEVRSEPGSTTFAVHLPRRSAADTADAAHAPEPLDPTETTDSEGP
jgi:PAS domain S-box-containing protein